MYFASYGLISLSSFNFSFLWSKKNTFWVVSLCNARSMSSHEKRTIVCQTCDMTGRRNEHVQALWKMYSDQAHHCSPWKSSRCFGTLPVDMQGRRLGEGGPMKVRRPALATLVGIPKSEGAHLRHFHQLLFLLSRQTQHSRHHRYKALSFVGGGERDKLHHHVLQVLRVLEVLLARRIQLVAADLRFKDVGLLGEVLHHRFGLRQQLR